MLRLTCIAVASAVLLSPAFARAREQQPQSQGEQNPSQDQNIPENPPTLHRAGDAPPQTAAQPNPLPGDTAGEPSSDTARPVSPPPTLPPPPAKDAPRMTEDGRLQLIRYVSGEFARAATTLPGGKAGYRLDAGEPVDRNALKYAVIRGGAALNPGDNVQITRLDFREREIVVEINGGGTGHQSWRQRVQIQTTAPIGVDEVGSGNNGPPRPVGATIYLEFGRPLPQITPDQLKGYLSAMLDFSKQRSAAVQWAQSLPPKIQQAIEEKHATIGMDRDEVLAAMGRPDQKIREQNDDGNETEDWIYGDPPNVTFVTFEGDKVIKIDQYPNSESP